MSMPEIADMSEVSNPRAEAPRVSVLRFVFRILRFREKCMRWHVHGTDVATGQRVMLALDEAEATHAVQTALSKRIIVSHVTREWLRRALFPLTCAAVVVLLPLCVGLYWYEQRVHADLHVAVKEQDRLSAALLESEAMVRDLKAAGVSLVDYRAVVSANARTHSAEKALAEAQLQLEADKNLAAELARKTDALADAQTHAGQLEDEVKRWSETATGARMTSADVENRAAALEKTNKELSSQIELLKSQLLVVAAKPNAAATEPTGDDDAGETAPAPARWALRAGYDAAANFVAMYFEKETMQTRPAGGADDGAVVWTAASSANAATVRVVHDRDKQRVYSMTLTVSLATDAPKQKIDENMELVRRFLGAMAPGMKDVDGRVARAVADLVEKDASERIILMGEDSKVTVWNNKNGEYTWRVESIGNDLDG